MSEPALRFLCKDYSTILQSGGWGNRFAIILCMLGNRFRAMEIPDHPLWDLRHMIATINNSRYPIVTWIVAKK